MKTVPATTLFLLAGLTLASERAAAQQTEKRPIEKGTPAVLTLQEAPRYPESRRQRGQEGWVELSYVVNTQGSVDDVVVSDSSGVAAFERAAIAAVKKWQYEPASYNGALVKQSESKVRIVFALQPPSKGASKSFVRKYKQILKQLEEGNETDALIGNQELVDGDTHNLYELAWLNMLQYEIQQDHADDKLKLKYLRQALFDDGAYVPKTSYAIMMEAKFLLEVKQGHYRAALSTYEDFKAHKGAEEAASKLQPYANKIHEFKASKEYLSVPIVIDDHGIWHHDLLRRTFGFQHSVGDIEKFEVRCSRKYSVFEFSTKHEYRVPESWGDCAVYLYGEADVEASMIQFPNSAPASD